MGIREYNPTTPGRRNASVSDFAELTPGAKPEKSLLRPLTKTGRRNNQGRHTARVALLHYANGEKRYTLAPNGLNQGDTVQSGPDAPPSVGNCLPLTKIPLGTTIHNV